MTIISVTLGMGSISFAYAIMRTGYVLGAFLTIFCGLISYQSAMMVVKAAHDTGSDKIEEIALYQVGPKF